MWCEADPGDAVLRIKNGEGFQLELAEPRVSADRLLDTLVLRADPSQRGLAEGFFEPEKRVLRRGLRRGRCILC